LAAKSSIPLNPPPPCDEGKDAFMPPWPPPGPPGVTCCNGRPRFGL
jgi:hypothetical protein